MAAGVTAFSAAILDTAFAGAAKPGAADAAAKPQSSAPLAQHPLTDEELPPNVRDMREAILLAVRSGRIEDLQTAIEWNEILPDLGKATGVAAIEAWRKQSSDGEGLEILAVLGNILALGPAKIMGGRDHENAAIYVWPYLAERPLQNLSPAEQVDLLRLMQPDAAKAMRADKTWTWWRLVIAADGNWLSFDKRR